MKLAGNDFDLSEIGGINKIIFGAAPDRENGNEDS